jgi:hypothetical protein
MLKFYKVYEVQKSVVFTSKKVTIVTVKRIFDFLHIHAVNMLVFFTFTSLRKSSFFCSFSLMLRQAQHKFKNQKRPVCRGRKLNCSRSAKNYKIVLPISTSSMHRLNPPPKGGKLDSPSRLNVYQTVLNSRSE